MAEADATEEEAPKSSKMPLILGVVLSLAAAGGGYFASSTGMILGSNDASATPSEMAHGSDAHGTSHSTGTSSAHAADDTSYMAVPPILINMPSDSGHSVLRFVVQLEVNPAYQKELEHQQPRVIDIMNTYLRALEPHHFDDRDILTVIRGHLMTRFNVVFGEDYVHDILIMEFLLS